MKKVDVIRAWKDAEYRESLTEEERAALPENPVGELPLEDAQLRAINGGMRMQEPDRTTQSAYCSIKWC